MRGIKFVEKFVHSRVVFFYLIINCIEYSDDSLGPLEFDDDVLPGGFAILDIESSILFLFCQICIDIFKKFMNPRFHELGTLGALPMGIQQP